MRSAEAEALVHLAAEPAVGGAFARESAQGRVTRFLPDKLPGWLETIHRLLPIQAMGEVTRGTLAPNVFPLPAGAFLTLAVWCVLGFAVTYAAMTRRA